MERLGLLGCGRIAEAMVGGLVASGYPPELICGASRTGTGARRLADRFGVRAVDGVTEVVRRATLVVLAVDPEATTTVLRRVAGAFDGRHCLVSVAASRNVRHLEAVAPGVPVVRAVPNAAVAVRCGVTALAAGTSARPAHRRRVAAVFERLGVVADVDEGLLDLVSTVFGIGPALFAQVAVEWAGAAVARGLDAGQAGTLVRQCLRGTGRLLEESTPEQIVARVASPNGMTEAALRVLDDGGLGAVLGAALDAAIRRSIERQGGLVTCE